MSESAKAIFLSYASQDAEAAQRICDALRAAGLEVWFDQSELRGGDAWDASIRRQIKECTLFLPLISANTDARSEGYFRLEWKLAVDRSHLMADDHAFLLPVVIDDTPEAMARVPDRFRERQWARLKDGETPAGFVERLERLLSVSTTPTSTTMPRWAGLPSSAQTPKSSDSTAATPTNLPAELPSLYGRADDLPALCSLIETHRLVTVVGAGGIGKTALAQAVGHVLRGSFNDGVWLVELAPVADAALVTTTVANVLHITIGAEAQTKTLANALSASRMLIVLDNCEHLLRSVAELAQALHRTAPNVRLLATSQEPLKLAHEQLYRLSTLAVPEGAGMESARQAGAVALFEARVQAADPRFVLTEHNVEAVVDICRHLDGIALAIELAAARVPLLGVAGVRARLDERFRVLTGGARLALRRHQTLRAALQWSYGLLSESEQAVFDRLGVFAGSFSLEAAQKLATDEQMDEWAVLDHLGALVDKSLVTVIGGSTARYRMLETTRAYALERLAARGATAQTLRRHAEVMLDLFERIYLDVLRGTPSMRVTAKLAWDLDNLRGALSWAGSDGGDRRIAIALFGAAVAGHGYFYYASLKARHWIEMLRPLVDDSIPKADAARFWLACASWGGFHSPAAAIDDARRAIALYRDIDDRLGSCRAWTSLAYSLMTTGRLDEAKRALDESLQLRDPAWPLWHQGLVENMAALIYSNLGELSEARRHTLAFLAITRQASGDVDECVALSILMDLDIAAGNVHKAAAAASELLARHPAIWQQTEDGRNLRVLATALMGADRLDEAEPLYREALSRVRRNYGTGALVLYEVAMFLARRGRIEDAARVFAYVEGVHTIQRVSPRLVARQIRDRLGALLSTELPPELLSKLYDEGRRLSDDEACALAFPPLALST